MTRLNMKIIWTIHLHSQKTYSCRSELSAGETKNGCNFSVFFEGPYLEDGLSVDLSGDRITPIYTPFI